MKEKRACERCGKELSARAIGYTSPEKPVGFFCSKTCNLVRVEEGKLQKWCVKCRSWQSLDDFPARNDGGGILNKFSRCKRCHRAVRRHHNEKNEEKYKAYHKQWREKHKEQIKVAMKRYNETHLAERAAYMVAHHDEIREKNRRRQRERYKTDPRFAMKQKLRGRMSVAISKSAKRTKGSYYKKQHYVDLIGCSWTELQSHLENKWTTGMSWENYGLRGWHIDHIIPCAAFDLTKEDEQKKCFHYSNLQPLWWRDNLSKNDKVSNERKENDEI